MKLFVTSKNTIAAVAFLSAPWFAQGHHGGGRRYRCRNSDVDSNDITIISATALNKTAPDWSAFEAFTDFLGSGSRNINWDDGNIPFDMPGDYFATVDDLGVVLSSSNNEFRVSNPKDKTDDLFNSTDPEASANFQTYSPTRLFTPFQDNVFYVTFSPVGEPGANATVNGFGAVFVDVGRSRNTRMTFYDQAGCVLTKQKVQPLPGGLSFLGVAFGEGNNKVHQVRIELGSRPMGGWADMGYGWNGNWWNRDLRRGGGKRHGGYGGGYGGWRGDIVVLDDFIYGDPQKVV